MSNQSSFKSVLLTFLKQLASAPGDLSVMTCPPIMLSGTSLLEYSTHWCDHPDKLAAIGAGTNEEDGIIAVTKWFLSTLYGSYASRSENGEFEKKPYNPILGEQFFAAWPSENGDTFLITEQVSHHPPITAFSLINEKAKVIIGGHCGQSTRFTGTAIKVTQTGCVHISTELDSYMITLPNLHVRGVLTGSPFVELAEDCVIVSKSGYEVQIKFVQKPWIGGKYNDIIGEVFKNQISIYEICGNWKEMSMISESETDSWSLLFDNAETEIVQPIIKDTQDQCESESRKVWEKVSHAIANGEFDKALEEKSIVENRQRALSQQRTESDEKFKPKYFRVEEETIFPSLNAERWVLKQ